MRGGRVENTEKGSKMKIDVMGLKMRLKLSYLIVLILDLRILADWNWYLVDRTNLQSYSNTILNAFWPTLFSIVPNFDCQWTSLFYRTYRTILGVPKITHYLIAILLWINIFNWFLIILHKNFPRVAPTLVVQSVSYTVLHCSGPWPLQTLTWGL